MKTFFLHILVIFSGIGLALWLLSLLSVQTPGRTQAASTTRYVAKSGADTGACDASETPCASVQYAVDRANPGDAVLIAGGMYTDTSSRSAPPGFIYENPIISNAYITKSLTLRGGFTTTNWTVSHPATSTTILDARDADRVIFIYGVITVTIEGIDIRSAGNWNHIPGGGIFGYSATVTVSNSIIQNNEIPAAGSGIFLQNCNARLIANRIVNNEGYGCKLGGGPGGG
jgi:hypothetical protein